MNTIDFLDNLTIIKYGVYKNKLYMSIPIYDEDYLLSDDFKEFMNYYFTNAKHEMKYCFIAKDKVEKITKQEAINLFPEEFL